MRKQNTIELKHLKNQTFACETAEQLLSVYKDQGVSVERGFRFLKDPYFYTESLYLKKPERIMALIMIMTLSLLVYSLAELKVRKSMKDKPDQYLGSEKQVDAKADYSLYLYDLRRCITSIQLV